MENAMDKKLQIDLLENIAQNGGWTWVIGPGIATNEEADLRRRLSGYTNEDYYRCTATLIASGKILTSERLHINQPVLQQTNDPRGLTLDGYAYLEQLRHPLREWIKQNWFPVAVAAITAVLGAGSLAIGFINALKQP